MLSKTSVKIVDTIKNMTAEWQKVTLIKKKQISIDTVSLQFKGQILTRHIPGQFYLVKVPTADNTFVSREYSLANAPHTPNVIEFGIQKVVNGIASGYLHALQEGSSLEVKGPMGAYFNWDSAHTGPVLYIAGGSGIVPFMSMIRSKPKNKLILIASMKTQKHFSYLDELTKLEQSDNFSFLPTLTREENHLWNRGRGRIQKELLQRVLQNENNIKVFICGRSSFVEDMYELVLACGIPEEQIQRERFG
jgi:ferredoxin-NADP reductase